MKRIVLTTAYLTVQTLLVMGQTTPETIPAERLLAVNAEPADTYVPSSNNAFFPGGERALQTYLSDAKRYPYVARQAQIEGTVRVRFQVQPDGWLADIRVTRSGGSLLDRAALQTVAQMPRWYPAHRNGVAVSQRIELPISFRLN